jgi:two-component system response regulator AtoC
MAIYILIIGDTESLREALALELAAEPHEIVLARNAEDAFRLSDELPIDLVFAATDLPGRDGMDLFPQLAQRLPGATAIAVLPGASGQRGGLPAPRGAYDSISTPIDPDGLRRVIRRARERSSLLRRNQLLRDEIRRATGDRPIIAASEPMIELLEEMERAAAFKACALLVGEIGTGKEGLARAIHAQSPRRHQPFVAVRCANTPEALVESELFGNAPGAGASPERARRGLIVEADGGTLFVDEIGGMTTETQTKLLEILQMEEFRPIGDSKAQRVDIRVIAASSRDLAADAAAGRFLPELHERLSAHRLSVPPLRERRKDIPLLFDHYLAHYRSSLGKPVHSIADDALERIVQYGWPGNNRELQNLVERAVMSTEGTRILASNLPREVLNAPLDPASGTTTRSLALKPARKALEADMIRRALKATDGNRTHAARLLDISHRALLYKMKEYSIRDVPPASKR